MLAPSGNAATAVLAWRGYSRVGLDFTTGDVVRADVRQNAIHTDYAAVNGDDRDTGINRLLQRG